MVMVWFKPWTWFSRNAQNLRQGAAGNLKSALSQYINAVKPLVKNNVNANITNVLKSTAFKNANGVNTTNTLLNKVNKAITALVKNSASALSAAAKANVAKANANTAAAAAKANAEANAAAAALKVAVKKANQLNAILTRVFSGVNLTNENAVRTAYSTRRGNNKLNANIVLNKSRATAIQKLRKIMVPPKYQPYWNILKPAAAPPPPAARALANILANTSNQALGLLNTNTALNALNTTLKNTATANGRLQNQNVQNAISRIAARKAALASGAPPPPPPAAAINKSKAAAQLLYNQSYGGRLGVGIKSGAWTVNKSVQSLTNTTNKMARFIGLNRAVVNANLNARPNKNQTQRAKAVLNAIIQKQKAVPGN
jgi:hypothetical protein